VAYEWSQLTIEGKLPVSRGDIAMLTETIESRLLALESKCRSLRVFTITLTGICVLMCGATGFLVGRVQTAALPEA